MLVNEGFRIHAAMEPSAAQVRTRVARRVLGAENPQRPFKLPGLSSCGWLPFCRRP